MTNNTREKSRLAGIKDNFPALIFLICLLLIPVTYGMILQSQVSSLSIEMERAKNSLKIEEEKLEQLSYRLKELKSLGRIEKTALSLGMVKNNKVEIVVLTPPQLTPAPQNLPLDAGPVEIKGAVTASLFNRLIDFLYGLLGG